MLLTFSTTVTDADPGQGGLRYNSATIASVTNLLVDLTDTNGVVIMNFLDQFGISTNTPQRGYIYLRSVSGNSINIFSVTGHSVDATGYRRIPVAYVSGSLPANNEAMMLTFSATGNVGPAGPTGATGATGPAGATGATGPRGYITERSVCDGTDAGTVADELCKIGMTGPGGGIVFLIDYMDQYPSFCASGDCNYLEVSPSDVDEAGGDFTSAWCSNTTSLLSLDAWDKSAVGVGRTNTATADATCTSGAVQTAMNYSNTFNSIVADDWWLPSIGELMEVYWNLRTAGVGSFANAVYWSSSEAVATTAWRQVFGVGDQGSVNKGDSLRVRPVRGF